MFQVMHGTMPLTEAKSHDDAINSVAYYEKAIGYSNVWYREKPTTETPIAEGYHIARTETDDKGRLACNINGKLYWMTFAGHADE